MLKFNEMTLPNAFYWDPYIWGIALELKLLTEFHIKTDEYISRSAINAFVGETHRLSCLKIDIPSYTLTEHNYTTLLNHIKKRADHTALEFTIYSDGTQVEVSPEIMGPNKMWLRITELNRALLFELFPHNATMQNDDDFLDFFDDSDFDSDISSDISSDDDDDDEDSGFDDESSYDGSIDLDDFHDLDDFRNFHDFDEVMQESEGENEIFM